MASQKVQAMYDFSGEPGSSELSIVTGEILTVTRTDVGEGWWEGTNQQGQTGLFPAAYVQNYEDQPTDYWDEEWDDEWEGSPPPVTPMANDPMMLHGSIPITTSVESKNSEESLTTSESFSRKNYNRYSTIVHTKSVSDGYLLDEANRFVPESEKMKIIETESGVSWLPISQPYSCVIAQPKKESKLKGFKSFIAYQMTPSFNNIQVYRRYKHFDWLHLRLREKYNIIPIPPLPDKQMTGRYEEQFIEHRKNQLQTFVDCVCRHPVLSRSPVWEHFITCTDDKMWKIGKRKAEKDEFVGDMNFHTIEAPERIINNNTLEQEVSSCSRFVHNMDSAVKFLMDTSIDQTKKHMGHYKKEFQKIGQAFYAFGNAMQVDSSGTNGESLTRALKTVGDTYNDIGKMHEEQPKFDWEPLSDMLLVYKGILSSMPDILALHKKTQMKKKECEKLAFEQKMTPAQLESVSRRTDIVSYALLAEINYFYTDNAAEVTKSLKNFLQQQVAFHRKITEKLEIALQSMN
ncbi:WASP-Hypothetical protein domain of Sorting nexin protein [Nesidiocoris tenuis]|uniref:Sorting nexin n=1 Tax=Nesidiocoris tenuis TaxID=355587 RepID=A0ABN7ADP3_9HEMI|nr:WASP-Hypothetical protein domain of Sorting nexin protein [Nesidiocoris tenuis]